MKAKRLTYDYDGCHLCGGHMKEKRIKQDFWIKGKLIVIENVPAGVCSQCGEKVVRAAVGKAVASLIEKPARLRQARTMNVPVLRLAEKIA